MSAPGIPGARQERIGLSAVPGRLGVRGLRARGRHPPSGPASTMIRSSRDVTRVAGATVSAGTTLPGTGEPQISAYSSGVSQRPGPDRLAASGEAAVQVVPVRGGLAGLGGSAE